MISLHSTKNQAKTYMTIGLGLGLGLGGFHDDRSGDEIAGAAKFWWPVGAKFKTTTNVYETDYTLSFAEV